MKRKALQGAFGALALTLLLVFSGTAQSQLPKQGSYTGMFSAWSAGTGHEIEPGHVFFLGTFSGVFFNNRANGFIDKSAVTCPGVFDIVNQLARSNHGYCVITDKDGDKAFLIWKGKDTSPNIGAGDFQWTGGTGKYSGLKGDNTFRYTGIDGTPAYWVVWEGEWQLP